jgi:hypothetical protein
MRLRALTATTLVLLSARPLAAQRKPDLAPYLLDRAEEIALARSAAPANVSDSAAILVLGVGGYEQAVRGTNGFTCFVQRGFDANAKDPVFGSTKVRAPQCLNPPAVRTVLPAMLERARWFIAGPDPKELDPRVARGYASHHFPTPAAGAMAYMTSSKQYLLDSDPHWMPHLMFYYGRTIPKGTFGAAGMSGPVIDATQGDPNAPVQVMFVPVRRWSDGSAAPIVDGH